MASFGVFDSFLIIKTSKNEGELGIVHGKARLKLKYMKNPSYGELRSLCQINQVCKEEKQRRNLSFKNFTTLCEIFVSLRIGQEGISQALLNWGWISQPLAKFSQARRNFASLAKLMNFASLAKLMNFATLRNLHVIFRYFCTDSIRFLSQDILYNYLFSPCN